jgi:hypothetical protein
MLLRMVTCMCCSGPKLRTLLVLGMGRHMHIYAAVVTCMCYSGPVLRTLLVLGVGR